MASNINKESGEWRDTSSLEFGLKLNQKKEMVICTSCSDVLIVTRSTVGIVCNKCNAYVSIKEDMWLDSLDIEILGLAAKVPAFHIPNERLLKFRKSCEVRAEKWLDKERVKRKQPGWEPTKHGPGHD